MQGQIALSEIDRQRGLLTDMARQIWENPEIYGNEEFACALFVKVLREQGFTVEENVGKLPTAFRATWGNGRPMIGFMLEYDALPDMSQKVSAQKEPLVEGANGHGCMHNLIGPGLLGAALGMKKEMEEKKLPGTLVLYGCPAEEKLIGKIFMAREGCYRELDCAFGFHPGRYNGVFMRDMIAVNSVHFHFKGKTAHAGLAAYVGRSALDAVELMNSAVNYLREHVKPDVRMHYVITNGGAAPNIVPDKASSWYIMRAKTREGVNDVYERILKIAQGAALMTETSFDVEFESGCYPTYYNEAISQILQQSMEQIEPEPWTDEERKFAHELNLTSPKEWEEACVNYKCPIGTDLYEGILPYEKGEFFGSSDLGDVSYLTPTTFLYTSCVNVGAPVHSWQATAAANHSMGFKGMIYGAKIMAKTGIRLLEEPAILEAAKAEHLKATGGKPYVSPLPDSVPPFVAKKQ